MALFSPVHPAALFASSAKPTLSHSFKHQVTLLLLLKKSPPLSYSSSSPLFLARAADSGSGPLGSAVVTEEEKSEKEKKGEEEDSSALEKKDEEGGKSVESSNGVAAVKAEVQIPSFKDPRWVGGTWDLKQFYKNGSTDWDAVIDAEARRRKWLEDNPEASSNDEPVVFDTSIVPWWAWMKRFHLPEAELLNGRAAMIGFFMAYFVDSLTGVGLVDQMGNFYCKTLLFVAVAGVLLIRKNEDIENLKKLLDETTFYDKQWQATWQVEDDSTDAKKK